MTSKKQTDNNPSTNETGASSKKTGSAQDTGDAQHSELDVVKAQLQESKEAFLRLQAEFANYKRRSDEEKQKTYSMAVADVMKNLVGVFDDFELALSHDTSGDEFRKGMELVYAKLYQMAEDKGLKKIPSTGNPFDPTCHEVLLTEESDQPSQHIVEELQPGYTVDGRVIRSAKVKVSK